ncbi:MAG: hypothetical protein DRN47_02665 [Candidatus Wolframiiraptor sp.]|nr:MAG: hypothetical protein DRN47_02665 [Candidatus Wolframiiraptor sp.]
MDDLGLYFVIALALLFMTWYFIGRQLNLKRQKIMWNSISDTIKKYSKRVNYRSLGSTGFQISFLGRPPVSMIELTLVNLDRENLLHYLIQKLSGKRDQFYLKASFTCDPTISLKTGKPGEKLDAVDGIEVSGLNIFSDNPPLAKKLLLNDRVRNHLMEIRGLIGLSISPREPHLIIICNFAPETVYRILKFARDLGKVICSSGRRR